MHFEKITEMPSAYRHLETMPVADIIGYINQEDQSIPAAVKMALPQIALLIDAVVHRLQHGGRVFYIGAGTSGRLGVLDASECPPTFGVSKDLVIGIMAGGDEALRYGIEDAEDSETQGWADLQQHLASDRDVVIGIAASGTTPYVAHALKEARVHGMATGCIVCNRRSPVAGHADFPIEVIVGPEFITGSTRMKSGTAQKLVLNTISTAVMIRLGRIHDNRMVNMEISNAKLTDRATRLIMDQAGVSDYEAARKVLLENGNVLSALEKLGKASV